MVRHLVDFFARRAVPGVEEAVAGTYRRSLALEHGDGVVEVRPGAATEFTLDDERDRPAAQQRVRDLFDLDTDTAPIAAALGDDPLIGALVRAAPDRRVPGVVDGNELAVRAVLGQQVSLAGAATLAGRLVAEHGRPLARPVGAVTHVFPEASVLAAADPSGWAMPRTRARRSRRCARPASRCTRAPTATPSAAGSWPCPASARGPPSTWPCARCATPTPSCPPTSGVRHALERLGRDPDEAVALAEPWRPYRAYALQHLWASLG